MAQREHDDRLCLGVITGAHGVRGQVRVKSFTGVPEDIASYGALRDDRGRILHLSLTGSSKDVLLAHIAGVDDRGAAEALKGTRLYVNRAALPEIAEEDTWYHADLIGLSVEDVEGRPLGRVVEIHNFGAGDVVEIRGDSGESTLYPFTHQIVPKVDVAGGRLVVDPPGELEAERAKKTPADVENGGDGGTGSDTGQTRFEPS